MDHNQEELDNLFVYMSSLRSKSGSDWKEALILCKAAEIMHTRRASEDAVAALCKEAYALAARVDTSVKSLIKKNE